MKSDLIIPGREFGDPREQVREASLSRRAEPQLVHGMTETQMERLHQRMNEMMPQLVSNNPQHRTRSLFEDTLPKGANWEPRRTGQLMSGTLSMNTPGSTSSWSGGSMQTVQRPYQPEFDSPDRQQYPVHRILANRYWRLFIKLDPVIGTGLDMYSEMPWSDCKLTGEGVEGEVREVYESMWEVCGILHLLPHIVREYLGVGEVCPHLFFDDAEGMWTYCALHNPDNLEVIDAPFIKMDPVVEFVPDNKLRQILTSADPELQKIRDSMPPELVAKLYSRQNIRINTETNATFIPRRLHLYETRGTSILSRMWRILMYEDAIFAASIATARRHAGPIKVAKLGNAQTNWIPGPEQERRLAELVAQCEVDPHAWLIFHYGLQLEAFGTTERVMTINKEWEIIERIKLAAMGISRSFLTGELTFASATAGLQVFMRRLLSMRDFFESIWLRPKFFRPIAEINEFYKRDQAELDHRIRIKRTAQELREQRRLIIPKIDWANKLNPMVDRDLIEAYAELERLGLRITKTKKYAAVNLGFEDEVRKGIEEDKFEAAVRKEYGVADEKGDPAEIAKIIQQTDESISDKEKQEQAQGGQVGSGGASEGGQGMMPGPAGQPPPNPSLPVRAASASKVRGDLARQARMREPAEQPPWSSSGVWDAQGKAWGWDEADVEGLYELLTTGDTDSAFWSLLSNFAQGSLRDLLEQDASAAWNVIDDFLDQEGYPDADIRALRRILVAEGLLPPITAGALEHFAAALPEDTATLTDSEFGERFANAMQVEDRRHPFPVASSSSPKLRRSPRRPVANDTAKSFIKADNFLVGEGSALSSRARGRPVLGLQLTGSGFDFHKGCDCQEHRVALKTPTIQPPSNHETRAEWQLGLDRTPISQDAKRYIKQIENEFVDGWQSAFEALWQGLETKLTKGQLDSQGLLGAVQESLRKHLEHVDAEQVANAFTGLYSEGKDFSYGPTNFRKKKIDQLRRITHRAAFTKEAVTIDTHEDKLMLEKIKQTALQKVKSITNKDLLQSIQEALTAEGATGINPLKLADQIARSEADKRRLETDYKDEESRARLRRELQNIYEDQLWKFQRIMRTETANGFVLAQLHGYLEQGIVQVKFNSHYDEKVCPLCRSLDGQTFEIKDLIANGNRYPLSSLTHPNCRCWFTPIIAYVTFDDFVKQYEGHPTKFVKGEPVFDDSKLDVQDIIKPQLDTSLTTFKTVPVEHEDKLKEVVSKVDHTPYSKHAPGSMTFVDDVYETDAFQHGAQPQKSLAGQVVSWHDPASDTTLVSSYAAENEQIGTVYLRDWATRIWQHEPLLRKEWDGLYEATPERAKISEIDPATAHLLKSDWSPFPIAQTYYLDGAEAIGLTKKFREASEPVARKRLQSLRLPSEDIETILRWRRSYPVWDLKSGKAADSSAEAEDSRYISYEASLSAEAFFRESLIAYVTKPWELLKRDPELYGSIRDRVFGGKEFGH